MNTTDELEIPEQKPSVLTIPNGVAMLCAVGALLAVLPHLANFAMTGDYEYLADGDQLLYMGWSRSAVLQGNLALGDAVHPKSGPMMHPWLLFIPPAKAAHQAGIGIKGLAVLWRCLGGASVALGIYVALASVLRDRRVALGLAGFLLMDAGFLFGQPIYRQLDVLQSAIRSTGAYFESVPRVMAHLRVVPPALAIPFLLAHLAAVARARQKGGRLATILAGITFGLLFHTYFYFWTTAFAALALAFMVDAKGRKVYATVAVLGFLIGLPNLIEGSRVKGAYPPDWLHRTDKFVKIERFRELLIPKGPIALWLLTTYWVFKRRPELIYWWAMIGAGFACTNSQVVTRLQIENYHWLFAPGVTLTMLLAVWFASTVFEREPDDGERVPTSRIKGLKWVAVTLAVQAVVGFGLRWIEATRTSETVQWRTVAESLKRDAETVPEGSVLAGDRQAVMLEASRRDVYPLSGKFLEYCAEVKDDELDERIVLNLYLLGLDADAARAEVKKPAGTLSWEAEAMRSKPLAQAQQDRRLKMIDRIWADPTETIDKYGVTHILQQSTGPNCVKALMAVGFNPKWIRTTGPWVLWQLEGGDGTVP